MSRAFGVAILVALGTMGSVSAQVPAPVPQAAPPAAATAKPADYSVLRGEWVRPDGGYVIAIRASDAAGKLDAMYFNPKPLPFAKAQALFEGMTLRVSLELRAGGYDGSTYELTYDRASDRLKGIYYQAVAKQKYEVFFARK